MSGPPHASRRRTWVFVPVLYFLQGIPYFVVQTAATTYFAAIRVPVSEIGHVSSLLTLPWMLKPLWSPLVDLHGRKRLWVLASQAAILASLTSLAFAVTRTDAVLSTVVACAAIAIASATHDVAADGFYLLALDPPAQARFVGVRSACFRLARVFVAGGVVWLAGRLGGDGVDAPLAEIGRAWSLAFGAAALAYACGFLVDLVALPRPARDVPGGTGRGAEMHAGRTTVPFVEALVSYFRQPGIGAILAFILLYRFGESMLTTMSSPFLLAPESEGGLALSTERVGLLLGTVGVVALIGGGILGGVVIARRGLRRSLWPMVVAMHAPNLFYVWVAWARPGDAALAGVIAVEQFGYGFGFAAYLVYLMQVSQRGAHPTTHYAISTGLMGLGALAAGYVSGDVVAALGFLGFFVVVVLASIPAVLPLFFIPLDESAPAPQP